MDLNQVIGLSYLRFEATKLVASNYSLVFNTFQSFSTWLVPGKTDLCESNRKNQTDS